MENNSTRIRKRSVLLAGHQTSVSVEDIFWDHLVQIAKKQGLSINDLITKLDANRTGNLSSAIRICVLNHVLETKSPPNLT